MEALTPKQIVRELNKYIVGQQRAKRAVAIALRNRWRRQQAPPSIRDEILPNNIILIGSTGVGKTEIARRLAHLAHAPFIKVEASKFTEVGYVGRDVESIVRDLMEVAVNMVRQDLEAQVRDRAEQLARDRLLDLLFPLEDTVKHRSPEQEERYRRNRERLLKKLDEGEFEERMVELDVPRDSLPMMQVFGISGMEDIGLQLKDMMSNLMPGQKKRRKFTVREAREVLVELEAEKLIDQDEVVRLAKDRVENNGIVFLDEIDKIVGGNGGTGPDVSREGVQRDLLPIVEGSSVPTKYGMIATDHILFIAAGAFHVSAPSDMIPELQGRFPIRVEMDHLTSKDFVKILTHPKSALIKQYQALLESEGVTLKFEPAAIQTIARIATDVNQRTENIGARRLHTIMSTLLDDYLFDTKALRGQSVVITREMVEDKLTDIAEDVDLSRYIL
ncbi:MAG: ATP-dependent protease ATPase subunit HslU [Candidatus Neomarinimicrobiota bacterium]|nr:MAG: ATP-dependent protease ATPase subunit HslU [Candidatus Neomarinimicrobiota bacterium]